MAKRPVKQQKEISRLLSEGWTIYDDYIVAKVIVMHKKFMAGIQYCTITKTGEVKPGNHPPES